MTRYAKASSVRTILGNGDRLGCIIRAFIIGGTPSDVYESSAFAPRTSRLSGLVLALFCAGVASLMLSAPAFATHSYEAQLTEAPGSAALPGPFLQPSGVAVDNADDVWIADVGNGAVDKFDASGAFLGQSSGFAGCGGGLIQGVGFGNAANLLYVADSCGDDIWGLNLDGSYSGTDLKSGFGSGCCNLFAAVDNSGGGSAGDIYVSSSNGTVTRIDGTGAAADFTTSASYISANQLTGTPAHAFGSLGSAAVDAAGDVYVVDQSNREVDEFDSTGAFVQAFTATSSGPLGGANGVAVDPTDGHILVVDSADGVVYEFSSLGENVDSITGAETPAGSFSGPSGVAVDSSGRIYVSDQGHGVVDVFGPHPVAPAVSSSRAASVGVSQADVDVTVNPGNDPSTYRFEYGPTSSYGSSTQAANLPASGSGKNASAHITGLAPDTTYHYRVVATNSVGVVDGSDETFHTFAVPAAFQLPENRAYELVSPTVKNGGNIITSTLNTRSSIDGNAVEYGSLAGFGDAKGIQYEGQYLSRRTAAGWETHSMSFPQNDPGRYLPDLFGTPHYFGDFSEDFSKGLFITFPPIADSPNVAKVPNLYLNSDLLTPGASEYHLLSDCPACASPLPAGEERVAPAAASADLTHVLFESDYDLTSDASGTDDKLYEWENGTLRLAGQVPSAGTECGPGGPLCVPAESSAAGGVAGTVTLIEGKVGNPYGNAYTTTMMTRDGSRVFFMAPPYSAGTVAYTGIEGRIFMRVNHVRTVQINVGQQPSHLWTATPDGRHVLYSTQIGDLYAYEPDAPEGEQRKLLANGINQVLGVSADGSYVYFSSAGAYVAGQPAPGSDTEAPAIYVWHAGTIHLVGINNTPHGPVSLSLGNISFGAVGGNDIRVTPAGSLLYATNTPQTGYDTASPTCSDDANHGGRCVEVYLYDPNGGKLYCVSCNPTGASPVGDAEFTTVSGTSIYNFNQHLNRAVTEDGTHVFFSSPDALVPQDTNGHYDIYEFNTETGGISLISTGQCGCNSYFVEASPDGSDVFFTTEQQLVRVDADNLADLYDARVGGGIAAQNALPPAECQGDSCQPAVAPPLDSTPSSFTFSAVGNPTNNNQTTRSATAKKKSSSKAKKRTGKAKKHARHAKKRKPEKHRRKKGHVSRTSNSNRGGVK